MTNNEAIGILAIVVETAKGRCFVTDEAISDAYDMAISALHAQTDGDCISRRAAIDAFMTATSDGDKWVLEQLPSAPEPSIPVAWIEKHVDWLKNMNNGFATLTAMNISTMVKKWKREQEEVDGSDKTTSSD